jgi:predicted RNase H-like HicB family nuclease
MVLYDLTIRVEELKDGSNYQYIATSPELPNLIVVGETPEEVLAAAPQVAAALIASMQAAGDMLPESVHPISSVPFSSQPSLERYWAPIVGEHSTATRR